VEIVVAEVGRTTEDDQIYRLTYDGSVADEQGYVAMGGQSDTISTALAERWRPGLSLAQALSLAVDVLAADPAGGEPRSLDADQLEVAVLDRHRQRRLFRRLASPLVGRLLSPDDPTADVPHQDDPRPGRHETLTGSEPDGDVGNGPADGGSEETPGTFPPDATPPSPPQNG
jgi:proteasome alpha subunit